jgi:hypothetical protein
VLLACGLKGGSGSLDLESVAAELLPSCGINHGLPSLAAQFILQSFWADHGLVDAVVHDPQRSYIPLM